MSADDRGALRARLAQLEKADRAKDQFLALLSRELRNHLHAIRTNAWLITARTRDAEVARPTEAIDRQVVKLSGLVEDLLDVVNVTRTDQLSFETLPLQQVVTDAVAATRASMDAHRRELDIRQPETPVLVNADASRLQQAIGNVLANAIKFSQQQGEITVRTFVEDREAVVCVLDRGAGIAAADLAQLFTLYTDGRRSSRRDGEGLGIGLHVARAWIEAHGGTIEARSGGPGKGSEFILRMPLAAQAQAAAAPAAPGTTEGGLSILVVDDNPDAADSLAEVLQAQGHRVRAAYGGEEAIELAARGGVQVALVDLGMPSVDGFQVAERISRAPASGDTLLVAVTGWGEKSDRARSRAAGFAYHLTKPLDFDALASLLATAKRRSARP